MHIDEAGIDFLSMQCMGESFELVFSAPFSRLNASVRRNDHAFSRLNAIALPASPAESFSRLNGSDLLAVTLFSRLNKPPSSLPFSRLNGQPIEQRSPRPGSFSRLNGPRSQTPKENAPVTLGRFLLWPLN